jgi:hypothetical protein
VVVQGASTAERDLTQPWISERVTAPMGPRPSGGKMWLRRWESKAASVVLRCTCADTCHVAAY